MGAKCRTGDDGEVTECLLLLSSLCQNLQIKTDKITIKLNTFYEQHRDELLLPEWILPAVEKGGTFLHFHDEQDYTFHFEHGRVPCKFHDLLLLGEKN